MRPRYLPLMTALVMAVGVPARAQVAPTLTADAVAARLMSFDRDSDGRITADELPERMEHLLARGDSTNDGVLDAAEVRRLAMSPVPQSSVRTALVPGRYAFADTFFFDTSQHIEGALDDLRLGGDTKERALEVARVFLAGATERARNDLMAAMGQLLTGEQLDDFRGALGLRIVAVPAIQRDGVMFFGATADESAGHARVLTSVRLVTPVDPASQIDTYALDADRRQRALDAIERFKAHTPGRLNDSERTLLVEQLRGLLDDEQRDDLHAALARRPVVDLDSARVSIFTVLERLASPRPLAVDVSP
jgi:hypothetical protein